MIKSISFSQDEIIDAILQLHCKEYIEVDPTFSKGNFYKIRPRPRYCFDLAPQFDFVKQADCRQLPLDNATFKTVILDGPFGIAKGETTKKVMKGQNITLNRFGYFESAKLLFDFYTAALKEMYRIIIPTGILILKIQPTVACGKQWMTHFHCMQTAKELGFYHKDEFILLAKNRLISGKVKNQQHARKFHSYFYVFMKPKR